MNRPLALIEGDLTIPLPRPFDGLPPPFGTRRRLKHEAAQRAGNEVAGTAQVIPFPLGTRHALFFYKAPPQCRDTQRWDIAMAEAKRYLEMGTGWPPSSRSDRLLAAGIFAGCAIVLTWLLATCSMKEAEKAKTASTTPTLLSAANAHADHAQPFGKPTLVDTQAERAVPERAAPGTVTAAKTKPALSAKTAASKQISATPPKRLKVAHLTKAHVNERVALNRAAHPATRPAPSTQPEWAASASYDVNSASDAPWLNWSAQRHRPVPAMRAATSVDSNWNDHMTQRRITDEPAAFNAGRSGPLVLSNKDK